MSQSIPLLARLALPVFRNELPGWGKLFQKMKLDVTGDAAWRDAPKVELRGKWHDYIMTLDLSNWSERMTFMLGRFYDLETQLALKAWLRPGDRMLDVGANIGMMTLLASRLVGPNGKVDAFEPNPVCQERLRHAFSRNEIKQVNLHPVALSDKPGQLVLRILAGHTGTGTLGEIAAEQKSEVSAEITVPVVVGDDEVLADSRPVQFIKIDVEGFETYALRGLRQTLEKYKPAVTTEFTPWTLERAGTSRQELWDLMRGLGYDAYEMANAKDGFAGRKLLLVTVSSAAGVGKDDVLWVHPAHDRAGVVKGLM